MPFGSELNTADGRSPRSFLGLSIASEAQPGVRYELESVIGEGGMGTAYLARRDAEAGSAPVVIKLVRAGLAGGEVVPELVARKEAVALGRLNERVPPTPFVVRLVDAGAFSPDGLLRISWTAIEYVHGGIEGTTLEDRVTYSLHKTGSAFEPVRAAHAVRCLSSGLAAIHGVSVIHRDLTPGNVLCCGFGETEIFKIADFGIARPLGLDGTFVGLNLGTIGYAPPEASHPAAAPSADVFSFAAVVYYLLTGQRYFEVDSPVDALQAFRSPVRASITDHATLAPELAARPEACAAIDRALARATSFNAAERPATAQELAASLIIALGEPASLPAPSRRLLTAMLSSRRPEAAAEYRWVVRHRPSPDLVLTSVAWDTDGHALALGPHGAHFWDGQRFVSASRLLALVPPGVSFTSRHEAGGFLVGGAMPALFVLDSSGVADRLDAPRPDANLVLADGHIDDLLTVVEARPGEAPLLHCVSNRRWLKAYPLHGVQHVSALQRLDPERWLLGGRRKDGTGFSAIYSPLAWEVELLPFAGLRAFLGGASLPGRSLGLLAGTGGTILRVETNDISVSEVSGKPDLAAAAIDVLDREWVASRGKLFGRDVDRDEPFRPLWSDPSFSAPFISVMAEIGIVAAVTADGGIVEGQRIGLRGS